MIRVIRNTIPATLACLLAMTMIVGCSSNAAEADGQRAGELACKAMSLAKKGMTGDMTALKEAQELNVGVSKLQSDLDAKYTTDSDRKKYRDAMLKVLSECK